MQTVFICCKNYDEIMNYHYKDEDYISESLIQSYQNYLFEIDEEDEKAIYMAKQLDTVMQIYITNKSFYKYVQDYFLKEDNTSFGEIFDIIALYHDYIKAEMKRPNITKWI